MSGRMNRRAVLEVKTIRHHEDGVHIIGPSIIADGLERELPELSVTGNIIVLVLGHRKHARDLVQAN